MKRLLALLTTLTLVFLMAACGGSSSSQTLAASQGTSDSTSTGTSDSNEDPELAAAVKSVLEDKNDVSISFWTGTGVDNFPYLESMVSAFQEEYPNIKVDFSNQGTVSELMDKLTQNIVSQSTPTLSNVNPTYFLEYIESGAIVDLMPYYDSADIGYSETERAAFYQSYIDEAMSFGPEGTMYGFPTNKKTAQAFFYNKTFFDEHGWSAPTTWDEVVDYSQQILDETGTPGFSFDVAYGEMPFQILSMQWGSPYLNADGGADIDNDASRAALEFYKTNYDAGLFTMPSDMPSGQNGNYSNNGFVVKECYMFVGSAAGAYYAVPKEESGHDVFEVGIAPVPQHDSSNQVTFSTGEDYCVFSNSSAEERVAAWLLIKFLSRDDQNVEWLINTGNLPITSTMLEVPEYAAFLETEFDNSVTYYRAAAINACLEMSDYIQYQQVGPVSSNLAKEVGTMWQSVIIGDADIDESIAAVMAAVG